MTRNEAIKHVAFVTGMAVIPVGLMVYFINPSVFVLVPASLAIGFISLWIRAATEKGKDEN